MNAVPLPNCLAFQHECDTRECAAQEATHHSAGKPSSDRANCLAPPCAASCTCAPFETRARNEGWQCHRRFYSQPAPPSKPASHADRPVSHAGKPASQPASHTGRPASLPRRHACQPASQAHRHPSQPVTPASQPVTHTGTPASQSRLPASQSRRQTGQPAYLLASLPACLHAWLHVCLTN